MQGQARRGSRGRYIYAGANPDKQEDLYIAREIPGSARDKMRDNAYGTRGTFSPEPVLGNEYAEPEKTAQKQVGPLDIFIREVARDRLSAALCLILTFLFLGLGVVYVQKWHQMQGDLSAIKSYRESEQYYLEENRKLEEQLEHAKSAQRIRSEALNTLGMLRREKADIQELYIQLPEETGDDMEVTEEETRFGLLDALLNLIGLF